jgi:pimeloyl-ACP methyl ester carboxylesterase
VPYELPPDRRADRRGAIVRWTSFGIVALLVALLAYLAYVGFVGSAQVVDPVRSRDCRTPAHLGWTYEAIGYDIASDARLADVTDPADCDTQPVLAGEELVGSDGVSLGGWYIPASNAGPEAPTIVIAHGHGVNKSAVLSRAEVLHADYNLVLFDFRNHGQSEEAVSTVGLRERLDLAAVLGWLEAEKGPSSIGLLGVSMGGAASLMQARGDGRVDALVIESTHATLANAVGARLARQGYPLSLPGAWAILLGGLVRSGDDMSAADPVQAIEDYGERPLLIIAGGQDDTLGASDADDLLAAARAGGADVDQHVCAEAGHAASLEECPDDYRDWVLGFFADALGS